MMVCARGETAASGMVGRAEDVALAGEGCERQEAAKAWWPEEVRRAGELEDEGLKARRASEIADDEADRWSCRLER